VRRGAIVIALVVSFVPGCGGTARLVEHDHHDDHAADPCDDRRLLDCRLSRHLERAAPRRATVVVPFDESEVASATPEVAAGVGGVILLGASAPSDLGAALQNLASSAPDGIAPFVMADVTMDLAPVLDADGGQGPDDQDPDGTRSFSAHEKIASADGLAFAAGLQAGGVVPVVEHFPGLGGATGNTDVMPASTPPWSTLKRVGLVPFENAVDAKVPAVMISNATIPGLVGLPASVSSAVITGLLRDQLGYRSLTPSLRWCPPWALASSDAAAS
jgi:beta-N-acetylhexosaminidase